MLLERGFPGATFLDQRLHRSSQTGQIWAHLNAVGAYAEIRMMTGQNELVTLDVPGERPWRWLGNKLHFQSVTPAPELDLFDVDRVQPAQALKVKAFNVHRGQGTTNSLS